MKKFLALYLGSPDAMKKYVPTDAQKQAGMEAWMKWATDNSRAIVDHGSPLGKTKRIDRSGVSDTSNAVGAYTIVEADSHEAAAALFVNHPHFTIFPGESVEIMECLAMPKM